MERLTGYDRTQQQIIQVLAGLNDQFQKFAQGSTKAQQNAELEARLNLVKIASPEVDTDYVRSEVEKGRSIDEAVQSYMAIRQNVVNQMGKQTVTPPVVPGSGAPPTHNGDIASLSDSDLDDLVVRALKGLQEN
jgi:hypothetical protein